MSALSVNSCKVKRRFERMTSGTFSTCWSLFDVEGRPDAGYLQSKFGRI